MPYSLSIDRARRRVLIVGAGPNDVASTLGAMDELAAHPDLAPGMGILCDFRENGYVPGTGDAEKLADAYTRRFAGHAMALVVSGLLQYGVANMITTIASLRGNPVVAFRDLAEAEAWLDDAIVKSA
jgi:hypothetical protein